MAIGNRFFNKRLFAGKAAMSNPRLKIASFVIQGLQLVASLACFGILAYFISQLRDEHIHVPWSFSVEFTVAIISMGILVIAGLRSLADTLPPFHNLIKNGVLTGLWVLALGVLLGTTTVIMGTECSVDTWHNSIGLRVCRLYKALFAFQVIALGATVVGVIFDFCTCRINHESRAYVRTENPKYNGVREEDSEYHGLTAPSLGSSSAPYSQTSFGAFYTADKRSFDFQNTPQTANFADEDVVTAHIMAPPMVQGAHYYATPQDSPPLENNKQNSLGYHLPNTRGEGALE